jgi:hypothetical protein
MRIHGAKKRLLSTRVERAGVSGVKRGSRAALWFSPLPLFLQIFGQSLTRALKKLDGPSSRDQVNNGDNQRDHQQEMD